MSSNEKLSVQGCFMSAAVFVALITAGALVLFNRGNSAALTGIGGLLIVLSPLAAALVAGSYRQSRPVSTANLSPAERRAHRYTR